MGSSFGLHRPCENSKYGRGTHERRGKLSRWVVSMQLQWAQRARSPDLPGRVDPVVASCSRFLTMMPGWSLLQGLSQLLHRLTNASSKMSRQNRWFVSFSTRPTQLACCWRLRLRRVRQTLDRILLPDSALSAAAESLWKHRCFWRFPLCRGASFGAVFSFTLAGGSPC